MIKTQKRTGEKKNEGKKHVWVRKDGIVYFSTGKSPTEEDINNAVFRAERILQEQKGQAKILVQASPYLGPELSSARLRKKLAEKTQEIIKKVGFSKMAIFGGDTMSRTITSFIVRASGLEKIRVFKTKEKALKWLHQ